MKRLASVSAAIIISLNVMAQNTSLDYKHAIKVYNLSSFDEFRRSERVNDSSSEYYSYTTTNLRILHPSVAFQWKTSKNNFHEIELTDLALNKAGSITSLKNDTSNTSYMLSGDDVTTTSIALRYEYILTLRKSKESKLVPSVGFALGIFYQQNKYDPKISSSFPSKETIFGTRMYVTPRLCYYLNSRIFLDLNIP
ncbi:MAG: hypothetical protein M3R27_14680, partial [Bacteroidota bacterium]|nr:hypothetical protein [Bacteroidota bacterium]